MDVDSWASRVQAAKSLSAAHAARLHYEANRPPKKRLRGSISMTNYTGDEEDMSNEEGEVVEEELNMEERLLDLDLKMLAIQHSLNAVERLRVQLMREQENIPSQTSDSSSFMLDSKWEGEEKPGVDASRVIVLEGEDDADDPTSKIGLNEDNHMALDDSEGDDDAKSCFPCPFCYVDIEVPLLCIHLEEEHCFDFKNAVCPLCAANLGKDVIGHFMVQHASSFKHRRKSQKSGLWTGSSAMLGKALLKNGRGYAHESAPDPLLSPFICNMSFSDPKGIQQDVCSDIDSPITSAMKSTEPSSLDESCGKDKEERRQRAAFVQQLIASTIFLDL